MSNNESEGRIPEKLEYRDGPPDELEVSEVIESEVVSLVRHPRQEAARLKGVAAEGEHGTAPIIEMALVARRIVPLVLAIVGIVLLIYLKA